MTPWGDAYESDDMGDVSALTLILSILAGIAAVWWMA